MAIPIYGLYSWLILLFHKFWLKIAELGMHVLLVEDDLVLADGICRVLRGHGMAIDVVHSGMAADSILQRCNVAAVVLDIGIPDIDGFEVVRWLCSRGNHVPVLLLTARDAIQDRGGGRGGGAGGGRGGPGAAPGGGARGR